MPPPLVLLSALVLVSIGVLRAEPSRLFDGKTFAGWEGDTGTVWRIERGEIVAGKTDAKQPTNNFLCTTHDYADFDLRVTYKRGANNGGVQFRSERVPNHYEVSGYQADLAPGIDGFLYDESRRKKFLRAFDPSLGLVKPTAKELHLGEWNTYRIRAEGPRIRLWVNDVLTVDYTEEDAAIPRTGKIALQIHSGATEIRYKDVVIEELRSAASSAPAKTSAF